MMKYLPAYVLLLESISLCQGANSEQLGLSSDRRLYEKVSVYQPGSLVTDHAAIDLDLHTIKAQLAKGTNTAYKNAERVYREGAFSKPVAELEFHYPLDQDIPKGTSVVGGAVANGTEVSGTVLNGASKGDSHVLVQYNISQVQESYVQCQVGGNPKPNTQGCFAQAGKLKLVGQNKTFSYKYDVMQGNLNYRTIEGFSKEAREKMWSCQTCPYPEYEKFVKYYGRFDYADHIITSGFKDLETDMQNGNMDFHVFGKKARTEVIQKAMAYMSMWMYVIHEMEEAVEDCYEGCTTETCDGNAGVHAWDRAVAYYTGSRNRRPDTKGNLMYDLADKRCTGMKTCGKNGDELEGTSYVNYEVFRRFSNGQKNLLAGDCSLAKQKRDEIGRLMTIPLIQGAIRYAHIIAYESYYYEKHVSEGAVFALTALPLVHACNPDDAKIILDNLKPRDNAIAVDFEAVKSAFERNYECMNVKCSEIGGVYDSDAHEYKHGAYPLCEHTALEQSPGPAPAVLLGLTFAGLVLTLLLVVLISRHCGGANEQEIIVVDDEEEPNNNDEQEPNDEQEEKNANRVII